MAYFIGRVGHRLLAWCTLCAVPAVFILMALTTLGAFPAHAAVHDSSSYEQMPFTHWEMRPVVLRAGHYQPLYVRNRLVTSTTEGGPKPPAIKVVFHQPGALSVADDPFFERTIGAYSAGAIAVIVTCVSIEGLTWATS